MRSGHVERVSVRRSTGLNCLAQGVWKATSWAKSHGAASCHSIDDHQRVFSPAPYAHTGYRSNGSLAGNWDCQERDRRYKNRLLLILALFMAFNYVDRTVLGLTLQSIKSDFALSDTQLGFLTGMAFAVFYSVMGIPIARWADEVIGRIIIASRRRCGRSPQVYAG